MPDRSTAGHIEVVFVMLPVVSPDRHDTDPQLELTRQEREGREGGEFVGLFGVVPGMVLPEKMAHPVPELRKPAHLRFTLPEETLHPVD